MLQAYVSFREPAVHSDCF